MRTPSTSIQNQLIVSKSLASEAASALATRSASSAVRSCAEARSSATRAAFEGLAVRVREPPEVMRVRGGVDHRKLRVSEGVQTFRTELPSEPALLPASKRAGIVVEEWGVHPNHAVLELVDRTHGL